MLSFSKSLGVNWTCNQNFSFENACSFIQYYQMLNVTFNIYLHILFVFVVLILFLEACQWKIPQDSMLCFFSHLFDLKMPT